MDWPSVLTIILGSSFLGALLTNLSSWIISSRQRKRHNQFLALTLAHTLEKYSYDCMNAVVEHDLHQQAGGHAGKAFGYPPDAMKIPDEPFKDFDLALLDASLDFPQRVAFATEEVKFLGNVVDDDVASATSCQNTIKLASEAVTLATRLRKHYGLARRDLNFGEYDLRQFIDEKVASQTPRVAAGGAE
jgi:hypothetical protein